MRRSPSDAGRARSLALPDLQKRLKVRLDLIIQTELEVAVMAAHTVEHHSVRKLRIAYGHPHDRCQK